MVILSTASRRLAEFHGYKGRRYPGQYNKQTVLIEYIIIHCKCKHNTTGQLPPAPPRIQPRRLELPPTFAQDEEWRRIGARRSEFLHLGMPRFEAPRRIVVKTSQHSLS